MQTVTITRTDTTPIPLRWIGTSCPWRVVAPATLSPIARDLERARGCAWMRDLLARDANAGKVA